MLALLRRHLSTMVVAFVTAAVTAGGPALAEAVREGLNADEVDGRDAVGFGASVDNRKGNLVATSPDTGRLPNGIIAKAPNADELDGIDSDGFLRKNGTADNAEKLDGLSSSRFARSVLPPGAVLSGEYSSRGLGQRDTTIHFRIPLSAPVDYSFLAEGEPFTDQCPGYGLAAAGHLCVYERFTFFSEFVNAFHSRGEGYGGAGGASRYGFTLVFNGTGSEGTDGTSVGEWAVGAP